MGKRGGRRQHRVFSSSKSTWSSQMIMRMLSRLMTIAFSRTRMAVGYGVFTCAAGVATNYTTFDIAERALCDAHPCSASIYKPGPEESEHGWQCRRDEH